MSLGILNFYSYLRLRRLLLRRLRLVARFPLSPLGMSPDRILSARRVRRVPTESTPVALLWTIFRTVFVAALVTLSDAPINWWMGL